MNTLIVVPVRGLRESKLRLASLFDERQRARLMQAMVHHLLTEMPKDVDVAVITRNPGGLAELAPLATVLPQDDDAVGLNGALQQALRYARDCGYRDLLMLPGDLPLIQHDDIESVLLEDGQIVVVGDRDHQGTNGLRIPTDWADSFAFAMGEGSYQRHLLEATRHAAIPVTVYSPGLAHDLDTPDDWYALPETVRQRLSHSIYQEA